MNISCIICSDLIVPSSGLYITSCGHVFHHVCLIQWIERSKTCPQCRYKTTEKTIHRVYLNLTNTDGITDDVATLQSKLDNLQFQFTLKEKDVNIYTEKYNNMKEVNAALRYEVKDLENKIKVNDSTMHALKEQIKYFKTKSKEGEKLADEIVRLKNKLKNVEHVQMVIEGSREQVSDMLKYDSDPYSLTLLVSTLKKALVEADRKNRDLEHSVKQSRNETYKFRKEAAESQKKLLKLQELERCHQNCELERQCLKKKIIELKTKISDTPNTSLKRIINESPAPLPIKIRRLDASNDEIDLTSSPSLPEKMTIIKNSESPYLDVKSSNIGIGYTNFVNKGTSASSTANKFTIFKQNCNENSNKKVINVDYVYDGLGGHSKNEVFPTPKGHQTVSQKRSKSNSYINSTKFRKLAPQGNKLNGFVTQSNTGSNEF